MPVGSDRPAGLAATNNTLLKFIGSLSKRQKFNLFAATALAILASATYASALTGSLSVSNISEVSISDDEAPLNVEVTSPDQQSANSFNAGASVDAGRSTSIEYRSSQVVSSNPAENQAEASLRVNGQEVQVNANGTTRKQIISNGSSATVVVDVSNQSSSSGQAGGGD